MTKAMTDNHVLVYVNTMRTDVPASPDFIEMETVQGEGDDVVVRLISVEDMEPAEVWGPLFSRVFDELGITLSQPGAFSWESVPLESAEGGVYLLTIECEFTEE